MSIHLPQLQNLSQEISIATRQIEDTTELERRIRVVWLLQQQAKDPLRKLGSRLVVYLSPEYDLAAILRQLQSNTICEPLILEVRQELEKYPQVEKTEIALIVLESLLHGGCTERARMHKVWAKVFSEVDSQWQIEVERTAGKTFLHLFRLRNDFSGLLAFLEVVGGLLDRRKWMLHCADGLTTENSEALYEALLPHSERGETAAALRRELSFRKFLKQEKVEGYEDLKAILDRVDEVEPVLWERLLEWIADSKFADLKREAWGIWFKHQMPSGKGWVMAVRLLKEVDVAEVVEFYKSDLFKRLTTPPEGLAIYDQVYTCARKSSEDLSAIHQDYMQTYATVREQRAGAALAKLKEKRTSPSYLNGILDDLEQGIIAGGDVWCLVLDKVVTSNSPEIKKRTWAFWCLQYPILGGEKLYRKIWQEAIKLLVGSEGVEFFCGPTFAAVLQFLIVNKPDALPSIYQTAVNTAKRSAADITCIVEAHQKYVAMNPLLKNPTFFEISTHLVEEALKQPLAYRLIQSYVQDPQADKEILSKACQWLQERLQKGGLSKAVIPAALELAEVLLELSDNHPGAIPCYAMAEKLTRVKAPSPQELALRFAYKALHAAAEEDLGKKTNQRPLEVCFDLMTALLPQASDSGFLNLLNREKIQDFQNCHCPKRKLIFWKEMTLRSLKMPPESGMGVMFACDFWKFLKESEGAEEIAEKILKASLMILPGDNQAGIENYQEVYTNACVKIVNTFQVNIAYELDFNGYRAFRLPVIRTVDLFIALLITEANNRERHRLLLLTVACNLVKDARHLKDFAETKMTTVVAKACLEQIDRIKESASLDTPGGQSFLHAARELLHTQEMREYYEATLRNAENLNRLIAIEAPALFQAWLGIEEGEPATNDQFWKFNETAQSVFSANGSNLAVQKLVWKFAFEFAVKCIEDISETIWGENLTAWAGLIDEMLAAGVKEGNRVSLHHVDDVIGLCDFAAPLLSKIALDYVASEPDEVLSALIKMTDLQINYSSRTPEKKKEALLRLVDIAVEDATDVYLDQIMQFAMDAERSGPFREIEMNSKRIKIDGAISADDEPAIRRKGITALFRYLLQKSLKDELISALRLASLLQKRGLFEDFQNEAHCIEMLQIFSDVLIELNDYEYRDIFDCDILINVFYALTHKPGKEEELGSLDELIGTCNPKCKEKAQKKLNEMIACFFTMCGENGEHLSKARTTERRLLAISSFDKFLEDCRTKHFLESTDLEKWEAKLALLRKS